MPRRERRRAAGRGRSRGVALIEALIAILLFSLGILGTVATQARSVQMLSEATLRSQAAQHATDLIAEMWLTDPALRQALYSSTAASPIRYQAWKERLESGARALPGAADDPPQVDVEIIQTPYSMLAAGSQTVSAVTVTIFWKSPGAEEGNSYTTTAMILEPQS
jgi:type IV pilus assembly protein PilV